MARRSAILRIGLLSASAMLFSVGLVLWDSGQALTKPLSLGLSLLVWLLGTLSAGLALLPSVPRRASWLVLVGYLAVTFQIVYVSALYYTPTTAAHSDNEMIGKYALEVLKRGENPYEWNFSDITRVYRDSGVLLTPFLDGSYQNRLTYPALPVFVLWVFDRVGLGQVRVVNTIFFVVLLILLFVGTPEKLRPIILLPPLVLMSFTGVALNGPQDVVWCAMLVGMILAWKRPIARAVLFGLAAAFHQQPWIIGPFLLVALWYESTTVRLWRIAQFLAISIGVFVLVNLPFMLMNFQAWALGTFEPAYATFNMYSQGFASLSVYGVVPLPREFYTALQLAVIVTALIVHFRHPRAVGAMFWVFPAIFFWLYYRGLANYWLFWIPPLILSLARGEYLPHPAQAGLVSDSPDTVQSPLDRGGWVMRPVAMIQRAYQRYAPTGLPAARWQVTAFVSVVIVTIPIAFGVYYARSRSLITASLVTPIVTSYGGSLSGQLTVNVTNDDDHVFRPRFAVQHDQSGQALPWSIISGPESLDPGNSAQYVIGNDSSYMTAFPLDQGAQVVVNDGDGSYHRRAIVSIPADTSLVSSDLIHNPAFVYWNDGASAPVAWTLNAPASNDMTIKFQQIEDRQALTLDLQNVNETSGPTLSKLTQEVTFPGPFSMWVYPTLEMSPTSGEMYGLESDDGYHRLWILFGSAQAQTVTEPANHAVFYQPAPLNSWSRQSVNLAALYQQLGWKLPSYALNADHPIRQIKLSLIASNNSQLESTWVFGAIEQDREAMSLDRLVADALAHPDQYYVYIGHRYYLQRDDEQAIQAYMKALSYDPNSADAYLQMSQSKWRLGKFDDGLAAFKKGFSLWMNSLTQ